MEAIRLEVCIYENEYAMCVSLVLLHGVCLLSFCMECISCPAWGVSLVLLHGVCLLSFCMECVSCPSTWCVCVVCVVHMGYVVFTYGCMLIGCVVSPVCTCDMWNLSHMKSYYMYGWFYSGVEYSKSL